MISRMLGAAADAPGSGALVMPSGFQEGVALRLDLPGDLGRGLLAGAEAGVEQPGDDVALDLRPAGVLRIAHHEVLAVGEQALAPGRRARVEVLPAGHDGDARGGGLADGDLAQLPLPAGD